LLSRQWYFINISNDPIHYAYGRKCLTNGSIAAISDLCHIGRLIGSQQRTYVGVMADEMSATYNKTVFAKFFSGAWLTTDKAANVTEIGNGSNTPIGKALPSILLI